MKKITCAKCGTVNDRLALEARAGRCRKCNRWIVRTERQIREQVAALDRAKREASAPERRSEAARKAWRTRKLAGKAKRTTAQKLDDARARVDQWQATLARAAKYVSQWQARVRRLEKQLKREEQTQLPLLIVRADGAPSESGPRRKYSAD